MKTYTITIPAYTQVIEAENKQEALEEFWENYDFAQNEHGWGDHPIIKVTDKKHG